MKEIKLFDYQEDMKERIEKALCLHRSVMAQMPTGTGKTVLLASVVESFLREHPESSVWIVAHRRELVSQIKETLNKFLLNFNFSKTHPSSLTLKGGSTSIPKPLSPQGTGDVAGDAIALPEFSYRQRSLCPQGAADECLTQQSCDCLSASASKVSPDCLCGVNRLAGNLAIKESVKAMSIQWLSKHYDEIENEPGMIVIDEAHHALAKTYKEMWERFPKAKFLGLTATPCRLNGKGFTDLFDVLVQSWSVPEFICKGRLATYDFVSIKSDGVTQRLIDSLQKRGADGDYQNKEMDMLLNKRPSIERLYQSFTDFAKDRKGIVYAINISHAKKITELYQEHGVKAVAIDSKTPATERQQDIEAFKKGDIQVLVNVDIFSEGFDCPDVEFVQLARPTLSLAKYLQMVGRGLRVAKGKKNCVIIDNVGLYRVFGLPSQIWNWNAMFEGRISKKDVQETVDMSIATTAAVISEKDGKAKRDVDSEMMMVMSHDLLTQTFELQKEDEEIIRKREKLLSGGMGKVKFVGKQLVRLTEPKNNRMAYVDLKNMNYVTWICTDREVPRVVNVGCVEFVKYHKELHSRTKNEFQAYYTPGCIENMGFYSRYVYGSRFYMCRVLENDQSHLGGHCAIFLHNDPAEYYWLSGELHDGSLVVMSDSHRYYWVEKEKQKKYIGCARSYEEERKMNERLEEIVKITNLRVNEKKQAKEENMKKLEPCRIGSKWGLQGGDKRVVVPPIYRNIRKENGFFAFEQLFNHWGVMDSQGKVVKEPKYDKVEVTAEGMAILSDVTGKTQTINLK